MGFANKLFDIVNDEPVYTPVLINLPQFKKLYSKDKSDDKSMYAKQLAFIWFYCDPKSPYADSSNRLTDAMTAAFGKNMAITKELQACIDEYKLRQTTVEIRALESSITTCDNLLKSLNKNKEDNAQVDTLLKELRDAFDQETDLEVRLGLIQQKMQLEDTLLQRIKATTDLIPKINKLTESVIDLREKVQAKLLELDTKPSSESIDNFIIHEFIGTSWDT
jgi:hypothetical protein